MLGFALTYAILGPTYGFGYAAVSAALPATMAWLWFGGTDVINHYVLRLYLAFERSLPLRPSRMLDLAVHLGFMRRVGNGYMFAHSTLRDHFAEETTDAS